MARSRKAKSGASSRPQGAAAASSRLDAVFPWLVCLVLAAALNLSHDRVTDPDSFYHWRHAQLYAERGLTYADFPWTQFSVIRTRAADLWYGMHVVMIPLTWMADAVAALKLGSVISTATALVLFYVAQRRLRTAWPLLGTLVFAGATADLLYRITMLRPHPISLSLTLLVFAELVTEATPSDRSRWLRLAAGSALIAWLHLAVAWLPVFVAGVVAAVRLARRGGLDVGGATAVVAGAVVGWLLRPHPWGALELAYIQVAYLTLQQQSDLPLRFGNELRPLHVSELYKQLPGLMVLLAAGLAVCAGLRRRGAELGTAIVASLVLWPIFFGLAFVVFRRANEIMVAFAVTFLGLVAARARAALPERGLWRTAMGSGAGTAVATAVVIGLLIMPVTTLRRFALFLPNAYDPYRFRAVGEWLQRNSAPGEIVFNADWDRFGYLVFWNPRNHYIHGMDPIFMYAYDAGLYWKSHYLAADQVTAHTYAGAPGTRAVREDTHTVLAKDFRASYVVVEPSRAPGLAAYLASAPGFEKVFATERESLFRVLARADEAR